MRGYMVGFNWKKLRIILALLSCVYKYERNKATGIISRAVDRLQKHFSHYQ